MIPTSEKLALALESIHAPQEMVRAARDGMYDDFKSDLATPIGQLVQDLDSLAEAWWHEGHPEAAEKARALKKAALIGKFDASKEEAAAWAEKEGWKDVS